MRDCNNCVYSARDGGCRRFECSGTVTVEDVRADALAQILQIIREGEPTDIGRRCTLERIYDFVKGAEE